MAGYDRNAVAMIRAPRAWVVVRLVGMFPQPGGPPYICKAREPCTRADSRSSKCAMKFTGHYRGNGLASGALVAARPGGALPELALSGHPDIDSHARRPWGWAEYLFSRNGSV